jgi:hypothetical protein
MLNLSHLQKQRGSPHCSSHLIDKIFEISLPDCGLGMDAMLPIPGVLQLLLGCRPTLQKGVHSLMKPFQCVNLCKKGESPMSPLWLVGLCKKWSHNQQYYFFGLQDSPIIPLSGLA